MHKLFITSLLIVTLTGCTQLDWVFGVDDKGNDKDGPAPMEYLTNLLKAFGTVGGVAAGGLSIAGTAYVSNKRSKDPLKAVINGIQKAKDELDDDEREFLVDSLKKHIPNKYHDTIKKIKDTL